MCMVENCTLCCIYRHKVNDVQTQVEGCCDECPEQNLAPEVYFQTSSCTCLLKQEETSKSSGDGAGKSQRHSCTLLVQTPYEAHSKIVHRKSASGPEPQKQINCDMNELCDKLNSGSLENSKVTEVGERYKGKNTRKAVCIALFRGRLVWVKGPQIILPSFLICYCTDRIVLCHESKKKHHCDYPMCYMICTCVQSHYCIPWELLRSICFADTCSKTLKGIW